MLHHGVLAPHSGWRVRVVAYGTPPAEAPVVATERRLPLLSTYLGHVHLADTQWYLEGSPELMREAMQWLQQRWEDRP